MQTVTIAQLKPGHEYPGETVNSRTAYRDTEIKPLAALLRSLKLDESKLVPIVAQAIAGSIAIHDECKSKLLDLLDQEAYQRAIIDAFKAKEYFPHCSAKHLLKCIDEALGPDEKRRNESKSKEALAKFCIASVAPTGWLPKQLRTKAYKAPDRKAATVEAPAKTKPETKTRSVKPRRKAA